MTWTRLKDRLLGEIGLLPATYRRLSWVEVDHILNGYEARVQQALYGHRMTAHLVYNFMAEKPLSAAEFLPLPTLDGPGSAAEQAAETDQAAFLERLAARGLTPIL